MYTLTLTKDERQAIDFVGDRYATGHDLYMLVWIHAVEQSPEDVNWDYDGDITVKIPEYIAWDIRDLAEREDNLWPLFSGQFASKMQRFVDSIV